MKIHAPVRSSGKPSVAGREDKDGLAPPQRVVQEFSARPRGALHDYAKMALPPGANAADATVHVDAQQPNRTGLPDRLKAGIEHLSGLAMDDVRVHYNSPKPAAVQALAYARGTEIHVGPGQERHLPHEAWHVVQQKQARVKPTLQMKGIAINDDSGLEREAEGMGGRAAGSGAASMKAPPRAAKRAQSHASNPVSQFMFSVAPRQGRSAGPVPPSQEVNAVYTGFNKPDVVTLTVDKGQHPSAGSEPGVEPDGWKTVQELGLKGWVRFHVLNENSGGSGKVKGNLTPTTQQVNQGGGAAKWKTFEGKLKEIIFPGLSGMGGAKSKAKFKATVKYYDSSDDCAYVNDADQTKVVNVKGEYFPSQIEAVVAVEDLKTSHKGILAKENGLIQPKELNPPGWKLKQEVKQDVKHK